MRSVFLLGATALTLVACSQERTGAWTGYAEADLVYVAAPAGHAEPVA
ncbi:MAG: hypothetical protein ACREQF_02030 [Candidatus Binataceae bacterium]